MACRNKFASPYSQPKSPKPPAVLMDASPYVGASVTWIVFDELSAPDVSMSGLMRRLTASAEAKRKVQAEQHRQGEAARAMRLRYGSPW